MPDVKNILIVGVGCQGTILFGKILGRGLIVAGYDVKMSEVHGLAQRSGSVSNQVRFGQKVFSPVIPKGEADILVSFEKMEALRWLDYLSPSGKVVVNDFEIHPVPVLLGKARYPSDVLLNLKDRVETLVIDATGIATALGSPRTQNTVLFGVFVKSIGLDELDWETAIRVSVKPELVDVNLAAFKAGSRL